MISIWWKIKLFQSEKCETLLLNLDLLSVNLYRDARPRFDCVLEKDEDACLKAVRDNGADITVIEGGSVKRAINDFNAKPIVAETYGEGSTKISERPAVAVIKSGSSINGLGT